jgi:hypothetical protein
MPSSFTVRSRPFPVPVVGRLIVGRRGLAVAAAAVATVVLAGTAAAQSGVRWTPSLDAALSTAKTESRVTMLAFSMDGERACEELLADHYRDPILARLATNTVNVFCSISATARVPGVTGAQQQAAELQARTQILKIGPDQDVIAPQHVFLGPDGAVLASVAYRLTKGELEWVWVDAIRKVQPTFAWEFGDRARAPGGLVFGRAQNGTNPKPPTKAEVDAALKEIKKMRGGFDRIRDLSMILMRSDDPDALKFGESMLRTLGEGMRAQVLQGIGAVSPKAWHSVVADWLDDRSSGTRVAAAAALEALAEPKSLPALQAQWRKEKDAAVRGRLLRAMAAAGPNQKGVLQVVAKALETEKEPEMRAHAMLAAGLLEDRGAVHRAMTRGLDDADPKVRATAAFTIAVRREQELLGKLERTIESEPDVETKQWMTEAVKTVRGGDGEPFRRFLERVLGERPRGGGDGGGAGGGGGGGRAGG